MSPEDIFDGVTPAEAEETAEETAADEAAEEAVDEEIAEEIEELLGSETDCDDV